MVMLYEINKEDTSPKFRSERFPKLQKFVEVSCTNLQRTLGATMETPCWCTPIWRPEYSINIWNLLWLSRRLIISTKQTSIYRSTFPNALTSKKVQNHRISIYFSTNSIVAFCHATSITLKSKMLRFPIEAH